MKRIITLILAVLTVISCTGCEKWENPELLETQVLVTLPEKKNEEADPVVANPLTGEPLANPETVDNRPVAVMLNNIHYAMPHHGVTDADIIFEFNVEGGITRMIGFFQDVSQVKTIGSVRSARPYYIETVMGMEAIYVHAGGSVEAYQMINRLGMDDIDEANYQCFWRDEERLKTMAWEHTLMTSGTRLSKYLTSKKWNMKHSEDFSYPFTYVEDGTPYSDKVANKVSVKFSNYKTGVFNYDPETGLYMINQYGDKYIDGNTGKQVGTTNLFVLRTSVVNSGDSKGHMNIDITGSGKGWYINGGKATEIKWSKKTMNDPFTYKLADGTPFSLGIGKSYVCVVDHDASVKIS